MPKCVCHRTQTGNSVPCVIHKTVPISELGPGRLIVIGDVHGCHDELQQLLRKVDYQQQDDNLVFVGDLVNKGPKSAQVICHTITQGDSPFKPSERTALAKIITPAAITTILCSVANFTTSPPSGVLSLLLCMTAHLMLLLNPSTIHAATLLQFHPAADYKPVYRLLYIYPLQVVYMSFRSSQQYAACVKAHIAGVSEATMMMQH